VLVPLREPLVQARDAGRGLGAFNVVHLEHAEALVGAAEDTGLPVVLQVSENAVRFHGSLAPLALATRALGERASVPVVLHLDHAVSVELVQEALDLGFTSVLFDGSRLDDATNRATTREVVARCHARGVDVEAELGEIGGKDGAHAPGVRTDPGDAHEFVAATLVDGLAVAVGPAEETPAEETPAAAGCGGPGVPGVPGVPLSPSTSATIPTTTRTAVTATAAAAAARPWRRTRPVGRSPSGECVGSGM